MLAQCEKVLTIKKDVIEAARSKMKSLSGSKQEEFDLLLQNGRAVNFLMDSNRGSAENLFSGDAEVLLNGMLEAAISVSVEEKTKVILEKEKLLREEKRRTSRIVREHSDQVEILNAQQGELVDRIKDLEITKQRSDDELMRIQQHRIGILQGAARHASRIGYAIRITSAAAVVVLSSVAASGVIWPHLTGWPKTALNWLTIVGLVYTGLALMGWSAPGLTGISRKAASVAFRTYCRKRGIPEDIIEVNSFSDKGELICRDGEAA